MRFLTLFLLMACDQTVNFDQVPLSGLPACPQGDAAAGLNLLQRPLVLEVDHGGGTLTQTFTGSEPKPAISLPTTARTVTARVGRCAGLAALGNSATVTPSCDAPEWLGEARTLTVDPQSPTLTIQVPGEHPCLRPPAAP